MLIGFGVVILQRSLVLIRLSQVKQNNDKRNVDPYKIKVLNTLRDFRLEMQNLIF